MNGAALARKRRHGHPCAQSTCALLVLVSSWLLPVTAARGQVIPLVGRGEGADVVLVRDDWLVYEPLTLAEILERVPGIVVSRRGSLGSRLFLQVAGSANGRVRLAVDGIVYDQPELAWARLVDVPVAAIERVEVHRFTDPARVEVWTRQSPARAPVTEIELGRGGLETRTRRVQLQTPRRAWWASGRYDEVLQGVHDFRSNRLGSQAAEIGTFNGRNRGFEVGFGRPDDESLRYRFEEFVDNTHGSASSQGDSEGSRRVLNALRWSRGVGASRWTLETSYQAWHRRRSASIVGGDVDESRGAVALDVDLPYGSGHRHSLRLRANDHEARSESAFTQFQIYDVELQTQRRASATWNAWLGMHRHERFGNQWSARVHARWEKTAWAWETQAGRGMSFAGWADGTATSGERTGLFASLALVRARPRSTLRLATFAKDLEHQSTAPQIFFPSLGRGPRRVAGTTLQADWTLVGGGLGATGLGTSLTWLPWVQGERSGQPRVQLELRASWTRLDLFEGDLVVALQSAWRFETRRPFTSAVTLPAEATGDVQVHLRVLRRMLFFWNVLNVADVRYESQPGVRMPERRSLYGVRVQLIN